MAAASVDAGLVTASILAAAAGTTAASVDADRLAKMQDFASGQEWAAADVGHLALGSVQAGTVVETAVVAGSAAEDVLRSVAAAGAMLAVMATETVAVTQAAMRSAMLEAMMGAAARHRVHARVGAATLRLSELAAGETRAEMWAQAWHHARR